MTVLITGGFGYLGGRIAVAMAADLGVSVRLGSRQLRFPDWLPQAEGVVCDLHNMASLLAAMKGVQVVVHLAAMNEKDCLAEPREAVRVNTLGTLMAIQAAVTAGVERFIYFSTAHVYGTPLAGNFTEQTIPRPRHPYAITHHAAEDFVLAAHDQRQLVGIVVRLSNGFGAPTHQGVDSWTLLVNDLCRQATQTGKMVLRSSGMQQRDFIPITDICCAVKHLIELSRRKCGDGLFNLGGGASLSVWQMTQRIAMRCQAVLGFTPEIIRLGPASDEKNQDLNYRIDKLKKTGFNQMGDMDAEIDATLLFCRDAFGGMA